MSIKSPFKVTDELAEVIMPSSDERVREVIKRIETTKADYLEKMAAAFLVEVGVPASTVELVQQALPWPQVGYRFYFRKRDTVQCP